MPATDGPHHGQGEGGQSLRCIHAFNFFYSEVYAPFYLLSVQMFSPKPASVYHNLIVQSNAGCFLSLLLLLTNNSSNSCGKCERK